MINSLYEVEIDGEPTTVTHTIWKNGKPIEVWYSTDAKRKKIRTGLPVDIEMTNNPKIKPKWYPHSIMYENSRINVGKTSRFVIFSPQEHLLDCLGFLMKLRRLRMTRSGRFLN